MDRRERERIMREGGVGASSPRDATFERRLSEDLESSPLRDRPLRRRLRNFRPAVDTYIASLAGPLPYMQRLREIEAQVDQHAARLEAAWLELAAAFARDAATFAAQWRATARAWPFDEVNELIERHNRFYPVEARLPMDPRTGDYVLVAGRRYDRSPLDEEWIFERFPPVLERVA